MPRQAHPSLEEDLAAVQAEIDVVQDEFRASSTARDELLAAVHNPDRFVDYNPGDTSLSETDARLVVANQHGYALWSKYESFIHLDPVVREVCAAARCGDLNSLRALLDHDSKAANPHWRGDFVAVESADRQVTPNDSIPLFVVSEGVLNGTNPEGNEGEIARTLLGSGADPDWAGQPMEGAVSFNCPRVLEALIEHGVDIEGPAAGVFMAYPMLFGFTEVCEILAAAGARLDLRFAAGLGRIEDMETWFDADGRLRQDPGLADPYMHSAVVEGRGSVRTERTEDVVLGQALLYACLHDRRAAAAWLVEHGADVNALVRGTDVDSTILHRFSSYSHGRTWRQDYAEWTRQPILDWLLAQGADPTVADALHGVSALHWAAHSGMRDTGRKMAAQLPREQILSGPKNEESDYDRVIRRWRGDVLVMADDVEGTLQYLAANPDAGDDLMEMAGHLPDADGCLAQALIDAGVDPMGRRRSGSSHLHTACSFNNIGVARVLLEAGADPNWQSVEASASLEPRDWSVESGTPMEFATCFGYPRLVELLSSFGGRAYNLPMAAALDDGAAVRAFFLEDGTLRHDAGARSELDEVPPRPTFHDGAALIQKSFEIAVLHGSTKVAGYLLDRGVDVHATVSYEHFGKEFDHLEKQNVHPYIWGTLLKHALGRGYDEIAVMLRDRGASEEP